MTDLVEFTCQNCGRYTVTAIHDFIPLCLRCRVSNSLALHGRQEPVNRGNTAAHSMELDHEARRRRSTC
jgi:hypothetical protein